MKKKKWMLAAVLSVAMVSSLIWSVPVDAVFQLPAEVPEGYEIVDLPLTTYTNDGYYPVYRKISDHNKVLVLTNYLCNFVEIGVPITTENMVSKYEEIKKKYANVIVTFDMHSQNVYDDVLYLTMYDVFYEEGNLIKDPSMVTSKRGEVQKMCQELQEAGVVTSASYASYAVSEHFGYYDNAVYIEGLPQTESKSLKLFVRQQFGKEITVREIKELYGDVYIVEKFQNVDEAFAAQAILEKQFGEITTYVPDSFPDAPNMCKVGEVNLLTAADACGDVDNDGTVSVEDAVSVLTYYAQQSAGLEAKLTQAADTEESSFLAADVDGNGQITVEDAVAILNYYAKQSAGLDAAW